MISFDGRMCRMCREMPMAMYMCMCRRMPVCPCASVVSKRRLPSA